MVRRVWQSFKQARVGHHLLDLWWNWITPPLTYVGGRRWERPITLPYRIRMWWWGTRIRREYYRLHYKMTGDCGHACGYETFRDIENNEEVLQFVPEAECPIHDGDGH